MIEESLLKILRDFGLPTVMCLWFMFRTEKVISSNTEALRSFIDKCDLSKK